MHKTARGALFFNCYDVFDVNGGFPCENIHECERLHSNGSNRAVSERLGEFIALSRKTARGVLFFSCYDLFDVNEWFPHKNIQECVFACERSNQAVSEHLG